MNLTSRQSQPLPEPGADALAHSARLTQHLREVIARAGGYIGFDRYMHEALYAPGLGYYSAGSTKFGAQGDFTTAPEVSSVFGYCLARQCAQVLQVSGGDLLEIGPGTGRLARDILDELHRLNCSPGKYQLLEVSADLRNRQRQLLVPHLNAGAVDVEWLDAPPVLPWRGVILANEVLDALPVRCFEITRGTGADRVLERVVVARDAGFGWDRVPADDALREAVNDIESALAAPMPAGYRSELCMGLTAWLQSLLGQLQEGVVILADYGMPRAEYYLPERREGTLICHYRHRAHDDPFLYPGLQDISAWVDFTAVARATEVAECSVAGFTTQAHFLIGTGLESVMQKQTGGSAEEQMRLASEVKILTLPGEMGERFKFMALAKGYEEALCGFSFRNLQGKL